MAGAPRRGLSYMGCYGAGGSGEPTPITSSASSVEPCQRSLQVDLVRWLLLDGLFWLLESMQGLLLDGVFAYDVSTVTGLYPTGSARSDPPLRDPAR